MNCPKCRAGKLQGITLKTKQGAALGLDQCSICGGVWFDRGELEGYLSGAVEVLDSPSLHPKLAVELDHCEASCPRCAKPLAKSKAPQSPRIQGDACAACGGLWLDAGETGGIALAEKVNAAFDSWLAGLKPKA
ncbi:MAG: zf-TFIIB domain-containing protein [Elusimicrobia bacterium]|nr:zf-TFIIB domain-containing protein [Elusimicrobiota bacterium]